VPQADEAVRARNEESKEHVGLSTAGLRQAFLNLDFARTAKPKLSTMMTITLDEQVSNY
jgi:hypothetical protein